MTVAVNVASFALMIVGSFFIIVGALGLVRMPDVFTRMHAAGVIDTVGAGFLILGMCVQAGAKSCRACSEQDHALLRCGLDIYGGASDRDQSARRHRAPDAVDDGRLRRGGAGNDRPAAHRGLSRQVVHPFRSDADCELVSTLLNAGYFLPIVYRAFFCEPAGGAAAEGFAEAPWPIVFGLTATAIGTLAMFFYPEVFYALATSIMKE